MTGVVTEEEAPWGGYTQYHHRSAGHQDRVLQDYGFNTGYIEWGYEDRLHGFQIEPYEENRNTHLRGPRRLMVVARKNVPIPERMLLPESIRPTTLMPYPINEHGASSPQELDMVEIKRKLYFEY